MDFFSFNFIVDVSSAHEMTLQDGKPGVVRRSTLISTAGNVAHLLEVSVATIDPLFEKRLACSLKGEQTLGFLGQRG